LSLIYVYDAAQLSPERRALSSPLFSHVAFLLTKLMYAICLSKSLNGTVNQKI